MDMISAFHFLRPAWFLALLPLLGLLWLTWRQRAISRSWQRVVDARLLPHLLIGDSARRGGWALCALGLGGVLGILALAGPAWRKLEQPVYRQESALVIVLDLSLSMDAGDIRPSRLLRAQLKLRDILSQRKEGDTALIVYAANPFVVTPLTTDVNTISSQIDSLSTDLMPVQGARPDLAINLAESLLGQAGAQYGDVLLIGDGLGDATPAEMQDAIKKLTNAGHRLSILGVGTVDGAPIPDRGGGFVKDAAGAIRLPKLDDAGLAALAKAGGGAYRRLSVGDDDYQQVLAPFSGRLEQSQGKQVDGLLADQWRDEGPWLLIPLMLLGALFFRRGYLLLLLLMMAAPSRTVYAMDWGDLWQRKDQRAQQALAAQKPQLAAQLFENPEWRAAANYRAGKYQDALDNLKGIDSAQADYNRGNVLAKLGRLPEAMSAYEQALKRDPQFGDARYNRDLLDKLIKQSPSKQQPEQQPDSGDKQQNGKQQDNKQQGDHQQQSGKPQDAGARQAPKDANGSDAANKSQQTSAQQTSNKENQSTDSARQRSAEESGRQGDVHGQNDLRQNQVQTQAQKQADSRPPKDGSEDGNNSGGHSGDGNKDGQRSDEKRAPDADLRQNSQNLNQADEQWLRRIPDDPGGLWRRKFLYQYSKQFQGNEK